jgi:hypothetical protein
MKIRSFIKAVCAAVLLLSSTGMNAQDISYKKLKDDPKDVNNMWIYLDLAHMNANFKNISGWSFNTGVWGVGDYKDKFGGEFILRYGWLSLGKLSDKEGKAHRQIEFGGFYHFTSKDKIKNSKIVLSQSTSTQGNYQVTTTNYIMVPSNARTRLGARAGLVHFGGIYGPRSGISDDPELASLPEYMNYSMTGVYIGLLNTSNRNLLVNTNSHGKRGNFRYDRVFADLMVMPMISLKNGTTDYRNQVKPGVLGWRLGWYAMPSEVRKMKGHNVKTRGFSWGVEVGMRPLDGFYFGGTGAICLYRGKSKALGYTVPASEQNTSE